MANVTDFHVIKQKLSMLKVKIGRSLSNNFLCDGNRTLLDYLRLYLSHYILWYGSKMRAKKRYKITWNSVFSSSIKASRK